MSESLRETESCDVSRVRRFWIVVTDLKISSDDKAMTDGQSSWTSDSGE